MADNKPKVSTSVEKELDKAAAQFEAFDQQVKDLTLDRMNEAPKLETEPQTKMSTREMQSSKDIYLKPHKTIGSREKFNEKFRKDYEFMKTYVPFYAENNEMQGVEIDIWTKPFPGMPAEEWLVPTNKPVWGPRYLAEDIKKRIYHRLKMDENKVTGNNQFGQDTGHVVVDQTIQRLDAFPVSQKKSIFLGADGN